MKIAICDDDASCMQQVLAVVNDYMADPKAIPLSFVSFTNSHDLLEAADKNGGYDIYILDIVMPGMNGIQLGLKLRNANHDGKIIYLTSSEEYAIDSFQVKAFHYIIKPIKKDVFYRTMDEALQSISIKKDRSTVVKTKQAAVRVRYDDILYVELCKRVLVYHLKNGTAVESVHIRTTFSEAVAELAQDRRFTPCGASMLINLNHVAAVAVESLTFEENTTLHLSKKTCRELRTLWNDYWLSEEA